MQTNSNYEAHPESKNQSLIVAMQVTYTLPV